MDKTFKDQLKEWNKQHQVINHHDKKPQKRRTEVLTETDIKSLMGINRATYSRGRGGAYRQK